MKNDYIVLQVRLSSKRLPGKLLLPLKGISIFEHILMRLKTAKYADGIVVATTADTEPSIKHAADKYGVLVLIGSEEDVLSRYVCAVKKYRIRNVIRATGDNPLVDIDYLDRSLILHDNHGADLTTFPLLAYGTGVEVIRGEVLLEVDSLTSDPVEREHITQYVYRHAHDFHIVQGTPDREHTRPDIRLTVDTEEDYRRMVDIYESLYKGMPIRLADVIAYVDQKWRKRGTLN